MALTPLIIGYVALGTSYVQGSFRELADVAYGRCPVVFGPLTSDNVSNTADVSFNQAIAGGQALACLGIYDAPTGGNLLLVWPYTVTTQAGQSLTFPVNTLKFYPNFSLPSVGAAQKLWATDCVLGFFVSGYNTAAPVSAGGPIALISGQILPNAHCRDSGVAPGFLGPWVDGTSHYVQPSEGFAVTVPNWCSWLDLDPAGALTAGQVTLPASPLSGQELVITTTQAIATLTIVANQNQTLVGSATVSLGSPSLASSQIRLRFRGSTATWIPA